MGIMKRVRNTGINGTTSPSSPQAIKECTAVLMRPIDHAMTDHGVSLSIANPHFLLLTRSNAL